MTTMGSGTVTRVPYTVMSAAASRSIEELTMRDVPRDWQPGRPPPEWLRSDLRSDPDQIQSFRGRTPESLPVRTNDLRHRARGLMQP